MTGTVGSGIAIVSASAMIAVLGFVLVLRVAPNVRREPHNEVTAIYFSLVGVLYAILLAFVVVVAWEQFNSASNSTHTEVTRLSNLWRDAGGLHPSDRDRMRANLSDYLDQIIDEEFITMRDGESSPVAARSYENVWKGYIAIPDARRASNDYYSESVTRLNDLGEARRLRILTSRSTIPIALWILLVGGGLFTVSWLYLFYMQSARFQGALIAALGGFTGFVLFLIFVLQHPFAGDVAVSSDVYRDLLSQWRL